MDREQTNSIAEGTRSVRSGAGTSVQSASGLRDCGRSFFWAGVMMAPVLVMTGMSSYNVWKEQRDASMAAVMAATAYDRLVTSPAQATLAKSDAEHGRDVFMSTCAACHGTSGTGVEGLGKDLTRSNFVAWNDDAKMHQFLLVGRPDARPLPMPPKGGRDDLTDDDLRAVVAYVRGLQDPRRMPELAAYVPPTPTPPTAADTEAALAAAGGDAELAQWIASGNKLFHTTCIACHGKGGVGVQGNGKALVKNEFIKGLNDDALLAFIKSGRSPTDPKNTTGIQMPPKGGNPALSEDDILDIISYLRTLQGEAPVGSASASQTK